MVLKQRFADGRTAYTDIGDSFLLLTRAEKEFEDLAEEYFRTTELQKDCIALIQYGERKTEPIYTDFPQWIYSNNGQLFLTLTSNDYGKKTEELGVTPPEINIGQVVNFLLNSKKHSATVRDSHLIENKLRYDLDVWLEFNGGNTSTRINGVDSDFITPA